MKERKPEKGVKDADFEMTQVERNIQLEQVFKRMLPDVGDHIGKQVMAHLILVLKLEGIVGKNLTTEDIDRILSIAEEMDSEYIRDDEPHDMIGGHTINSKTFH